MNQLRKAIIHISLILTVILLYVLQANFFNWFTIAGVMPNLFVILVLFIGLFSGRTMGTIYGLIIGILWDLLLGTQIGIHSFALGLIGFLTATFDKNFSKDSRITIMVMVIAATIVFEVCSYFLTYVVTSSQIEIFYFLRILAIEIVYNLILTIIIYPLFQRFGYAMENEYNETKILTKYF